MGTWGVRGTAAIVNTHQSQSFLSVSTITSLKINYELIINIRSSTKIQSSGSIEVRKLEQL
jgi:hypothetical protein